MYLKDIENQKWKVSDSLRTVPFELSGIDILEQEFGLNRLRAGIKDVKNPEVTIHCSDQLMITDLKDSEFFTLTEVTYSSKSRNEGFILMIEGVLEPEGLTIRKKKPVFTEEEREVRAERARRNFAR